jgi:hypothetical protein
VTKSSEQHPIRSIDDIPGWFTWVDQDVFEHFLSAGSVIPHGDLVELGAYLGKSAALIGKFKRPDETFTVCDLFGTAAGDNSNQAENNRAYGTLSRPTFEHNYLALHSELPVIVQDFSSAIVNHVKPESVRFVHVDASHLYEHVAGDVESARTMLVPGGVVVFDDFRSKHTPGVAAAVWEAVFVKELRPICVTVQKFYGTFGDPGPHQERLVSWLKKSGRFNWETQQIAGAPVVRIVGKTQQRPGESGGGGEPGNLIKRLTTIDRRLARLQADVSELKQSPASIAWRSLRHVRRVMRNRSQRPHS